MNLSEEQLEKIGATVNMSIRLEGDADTRTMTFFLKDEEMDVDLDVTVRDSWMVDIAKLTREYLQGVSSVIGNFILHEGLSDNEEDAKEGTERS